MEQDIDTSRLTADSADRLRALFEASAGAARKGGAAAEEAFLLGLSGLMHTFVSERVAGGENPPKPISLGEKPSAIDTSGLTAADALTAAQVCIGIAERFNAEGKDAIGMLFMSLADKLGAIVRSKVAAASSSTTIQ